MLVKARTMTRCCRTLATALGVALLLGAPARAADPSAGPPPAPLAGPSAGPSPVLAKLGRRSLAPTPDYAMPRAGGTVSPTRIARDGWQHCALTFDDGPNEITPRILDILKRERVIATYFPIAATAARHPDAVRAFVAAGYEIGNHSLAHRNLAKLSPAAQRADLAEANRILTGLGARPTLFRPPYAAYDARLIESARGVGLETVLWSLDVRDWEYHDAGMLAARVDAGAGPALVVLMHATY
jgi:peptidoglycan/xylan/chitin deacetylase (PgdA/CDA1 family)